MSSWDIQLAEFHAEQDAQMLAESTGTVTFKSGVVRPAKIINGIVHFDKARTAKASWAGWHKAPEALAATYTTK